MLDHIWFLTLLSYFTRLLMVFTLLPLKTNLLWSLPQYRNTHLSKIAWIDQAVLPLFRLALSCPFRNYLPTARPAQVEPVPSSVLPRYRVCSCSFMWCLESGYLFVLSSPLACEILRVRIESPSSLLLTPCMVSGIELVCSDSDVHLIALNWNCKSWLQRFYNLIQRKDVYANKCHWDRKEHAVI